MPLRLRSTSRTWQHFFGKSVFRRHLVNVTIIDCVQKQALGITWLNGRPVSPPLSNSDLASTLNPPLISLDLLCCDIHSSVLPAGAALVSQSIRVVLMKNCSLAPERKSLRRAGKAKIVDDEGVFFMGYQSF